MRGLDTLLTEDSGLNLSLIASRTRLLKAQWKQKINTPWNRQKGDRPLAFPSRADQDFLPRARKLKLWADIRPQNVLGIGNKLSWGVCMLTWSEFEIANTYWNKIVLSFTENTPKTHVIPSNGRSTSRFHTEDLEISNTMQHKQLNTNNTQSNDNNFALN